MADPQVLVVEDDSGIARMIQLALAERGHKVALAANLSQALRVADEIKPALVLLDIRLEGVDGRVFARAYANRSTCAIVVMTASQDAEEAAASIGADGHLAKPFDLDALYALVDRYVPPPD